MTTLALPEIANREKLIAKAMQSLNKLPPFSPVFSKLLASLSNENVSVSELADWVEKDAIIAGQLLRTVNSAAYGQSGTISSLRRAVAILGLAKLRNISLGMSVSRIWTHIRTPKSWSTAHFNLHSAACAIMADQIAAQASVEFGEAAFVAGLLHDIGRLVIALGLPDEYELVQQAYSESVRPYWEVEQEQLGFTHGELGGMILQKWNLTQPVQLAVSTHHGLAIEPIGTHSLGWALEVADETVNRMGIAIMIQQTPPEDGTECLAQFGLEASSTKILKSFNLEFEELKAIF